ncbi:MAG: coenzyme F420-0:L-glutamate ligase [Thermodesulfobacteriota bacterium]
MPSKTNKINIIAVNNFPQIKPGDNLPRIIVDSILNDNIEINNNDIILVAQKIVSKAENRIVNLSKVKPTAFSKTVAKEVSKDPRLVEVILSETNKIIRMDLRKKDKGRLIVENRDGLILANAGVDTSNVSGGNFVTLLPLDSDKSAARIKNRIEKKTGKKVAVIITDTVGRPWRDGLVDIAIGCAGISALDDKRGTHDSRGFKLNATVMATADQASAAAGLLMEKNSQTPLVIVRGLQYKRSSRGSKPLIRNPKEDLFR